MSRDSCGYMAGGKTLTIFIGKGKGMLLRLHDQAAGWIGLDVDSLGP